MKPGLRFKLANGDRPDLEREYLITSVSHSGSHEFASEGGNGGPIYQNQFECVPFDAPVRPASRTAKPRVHGPQTAIVTGPEGEEIHTDEHGRIRVRFHWDRSLRRGDDCSCWIPVAQTWAGPGWGALFLPRIGMEVLVQFIDGDPDRPIVTGMVYNGEHMPPWKLPDNKTQSGWKSNSTGGTGGYNEMMFEDKKGSELVRMQAEKDLNKLVKNDEQVKIGRDRTKQVGRDAQEHVGQDRTRTVGRNEAISIGKDLVKQVAGNERISIGKNQRVNVGINRSTEVGFVDSTVVGETHVVKISPPGAGGEAKSSSITMTDKKIVLDTGAGATIVMENDKITLDAEVTATGQTVATIQPGATAAFTGSSDGSIPSSWSGS